MNMYIVVCIYIYYNPVHMIILIYIYTHRLPENPQIQDTTIHSCPF